MPLERLALLSLLGFAFPAAAQFEGRIVSPDGALEGVVVSARKSGSPVTVSVVSSADGRFSFPAARLEPGSYALRIRATGYELDIIVRRGRRLVFCEVKAKGGPGFGDPLAEERSVTTS